MKLWIPLTFILVAAILVGGTYYALNKSVSPPPNIVKKTLPVPQTKDSVPLVRAKLMLEPEITSIRPGEEVNYVVRIDAGNAFIVGAETYFNYDPNLISVESLEPGPVFTKPEILAQSIDPNSGKITYAVGTFTPSSGKGIVFKIKVKGVTASPSIQSLLSFDRDKTKIALVSEDGSKRYSETETNLEFAENQLLVQP